MDFRQYGLAIVRSISCADSLRACGHRPGGSRIENQTNN